MSTFSAAPAPPAEEELFRRKSLEQLNTERPLGAAFFNYDRATLRDETRTKCPISTNHWSVLNVSCADGAQAYTRGGSNLLRRYLLAVGVVTGLLVLAAVVFLATRHSPTPGLLAAQQTGATSDPVAPAPPTGIRLSGTVEAVRASTVIVPRLAGQNASTLVITHLVKAGTRVAPGDALVEFDPQDQLRAAMDRRAEVADLDGQIQKKHSDQAIARAADETALAQAQHDLERARLELLKNPLIAPVEAEKNTLAFEQGTAKLKQLQDTMVLKQRAAAADLQILAIRRERSTRALHYAESNTKLMAVRAEFAGIAVIKSTWKGNSLGEVLEGDEVRPGLPILDVIDPSAMQVRARVNQADISLIASGQAATIRLDAYPELAFDGQVELLAPLGVSSGMGPKVRTFTALISIHGTHPRLMPDLTASVDVAPAPPRPPSAPPAGTH